MAATDEKRISGWVLWAGALSRLSALSAAGDGKRIGSMGETLIRLSAPIRCPVVVLPVVLENFKKAAWFAFCDSLVSTPQSLVSFSTYETIYERLLMFPIPQPTLWPVSRP